MINYVDNTKGKLGYKIWSYNSLTFNPIFSGSVYVPVNWVALFYWELCLRPSVIFLTKTEGKKKKNSRALCSNGLVSPTLIKATVAQLRLMLYSWEWKQKKCRELPKIKHHCCQSHFILQQKHVFTCIWQIINLIHNLVLFSRLQVGRWIPEMIW